jgi:hypothetical protein
VDHFADMAGGDQSNILELEPMGVFQYTFSDDLIGSGISRTHCSITQQIQVIK